MLFQATGFMCICHSGRGESEDIFLEEMVDTLDNTELFNLHKAKKKKKCQNKTQLWRIAAGNVLSAR